jgi:hypothetical protein
MYAQTASSPARQVFLPEADQLHLCKQLQQMPHIPVKDISP